MLKRTVPYGPKRLQGPVPHWRKAPRRRNYGCVKIGPRLLLFSVACLILAILPTANNSSEIGAAAISALAETTVEPSPELLDAEAFELPPFVDASSAADAPVPVEVTVEVLAETETPEVSQADAPVEATTEVVPEPSSSPAATSGPNLSELIADLPTVQLAAATTASAVPTTSTVAPTTTTTDDATELTADVVLAEAAPDVTATVEVAPTVTAPTVTAPTATTTTTIVPVTTVPVTRAPTTTVAPVLAQPAPVQLSLQEQMLAQVSFDWRAEFPDWVVVFGGERAGVRGLTYPGEKRIEIFIRSDDTVDLLHRVFAHELGHVVDVERNSNADRQRWREQRGIGDNVDWWPSSESPDFATGAGDFAEAFAVLETGVATRSTVAPQPTAADLALLRELVRG